MYLLFAFTTGYQKVEGSDLSTV